jgi:hypothetical protein
LADLARSWQIVPTRQATCAILTHALGKNQVEGQMTRLRNVVLGGLAALAIGGAAGSAWAEESGSFENRLTGATIGLPLGALPPPGLYTGLETAYLGMGHAAASTGTFIPGGVKLVLPALAQAVPLLWVPGWNFLGASYGISVVQAFYNNNSTGGTASQGTPFSPAGAAVAAGNYTTANTFFNPITLSWNLGGGWFVSAAFNFVAPDGTKSTAADTTPNPDYWTLEPAFAVSYLANNWNITGNFFYDINTKTTGTCCSGALGAGVTSGNLFYGDLHALYKFGKWSIGPVGNFEFQTTSDTGCSVAATALGVCNKYGYGAVGALVGYDFGPVDLQFWFTDTVASQNAPQGVGGLNLWTRLGFRIWGPEAPHPLVAKN